MNVPLSHGEITLSVRRLPDGGQYVATDDLVSKYGLGDTSYLAVMDWLRTISEYHSILVARQDTLSRLMKKDLRTLNQWGWGDATLNSFSIP